MKITIIAPKFHAHFERNAVRKFLRQIGNKTKEIMVQQAASPKTGREYHIGGGRTYIASSDTEYPANKFTRLSKSYRVANAGPNAIEVGTDVPYAYYLRAGTKKMKPRKFLKEAMETALEHEHMTQPFAVWVKG